MTIYSLYVFDRHCTCVYYHDWHRTKRPKPAGKDALLPGVSRAVSYQPPSVDGIATASTFSSPRNTLMSTSGVVVAVNEDLEAAPLQVNNGPGALKLNNNSSGVPPPPPPPSSTALPFDEEAKLVYGVMLSLRTMMKKLSKKDESFTAYRTSTYKMHLYETPTLYKFVLLTDPKADSSPTSAAPVRLILRQIYAGPFLEFVVRNPLMSMDSRAQGIDNEYFRASVDRLIRGLSIFQ